jgi:hypothetical protein
VLTATTIILLLIIHMQGASKHDHSMNIPNVVGAYTYNYHPSFSLLLWTSLDLYAHILRLDIEAVLKNW